MTYLKVNARIQYANLTRAFSSVTCIRSHSNALHQLYREKYLGIADTPYATGDTSSPEKFGSDSGGSSTITSRNKDFYNNNDIVV